MTRALLLSFALLLGGCACDHRFDSDHVQGGVEKLRRAVHMAARDELDDEDLAEVDNTADQLKRHAEALRGE